MDGVLSESAWASAPAIDRLTMIEPVEGGDLDAETQIFVLASPTHLIIGVAAQDPEPAGIVSSSKARDPELKAEDYIKVVLDPFLDGRTGYIFALNPGGARYDALVARRGEGEDPQWDAVWEAATSRDSEGWYAEIRIPLQSLTFDGSLDRWGFNVERRVERLQEVSRWASPFRDAKIAQTSRAGLLTDLPRFDTGAGLTIRPAIVAGGAKAGENGSWEGTFEPSLDVFQRLGSNSTAMVTVNTDFAETEVDTRRTNLTRFPLFFPEKRTFFLEGSDIFDFGIGMSSPYHSDVVPFFTRRIGLYEGEAVPLSAGGKVSGKAGNTNYGALVTRTGQVGGLVPRTTMAAVRVRQNILEESNVGVLATFGDPSGVDGSHMVGVDATYQTSRLFGSKNFIAGFWGLATDRDGLKGEKTAFGAKVDYPNDTWDVALTYL
ncbi:MAG: carbohydrate binding family 9 domain-containing protein, partial [Gemmatimonadetes bacterium]|nr:carbohydrate binding family 9 domain-containing protein [Gemmatimonadota bacterium]